MMAPTAKMKQHPPHRTPDARAPLCGVERCALLGMKRQQRTIFLSLNPTERLVVLALPVARRAEFMNMSADLRRQTIDHLGNEQGKPSCSNNCNEPIHVQRPALSRLYCATSAQIDAHCWVNGQSTNQSAGTATTTAGVAPWRPPCSACPSRSC